MIHPPNRFLAQYLVNIGAAVFPQQARPEIWPIVYGNLPDGPADHLAVQNYGWSQMGRFHTGERAVDPQCQVLIRSSDPQLGFIKGQEIERLLDKVGTFPQHGGVWTQSVTIVDEELGNETIIFQSIGVTVPTFIIGQEPGNQRWLHGMHIRLKYQP